MAIKRKMKKLTSSAPNKRRRQSSPSDREVKKRKRTSLPSSELSLSSSGSKKSTKERNEVRKGNETHSTPIPKIKKRNKALTASDKKKKANQRHSGIVSLETDAIVDHNRQQRNINQQRVNSDRDGGIDAKISTSSSCDKTLVAASRILREHLKELNTMNHPSSKKMEIGPITCKKEEGYLYAYRNLPPLKHRDELPACYYRACIFEGYRDHWTWHQTVVSLFSIHNETMCIWSHFIPFLCAVIAAFWVILKMQTDGSSFTEQFLMALFIFTACSCLLLSSTYHWFGCMSEGHYYCLLSLDLGGIAMLISGSFFPGVYYGFYCTPVLQKVYLLVSFLIFLIGILISIYGASKSPHAALIRQGGFASLTIFGFVPLCHWLLIAPNEYRNQMTMGALGMFFFYGVGFSFLLTSFPESVWTNNYITTYWVPSHALWHLGVAAAIFTWLFALLGQKELIKELGCQPFDDYIDEFSMHNYAY